jgi:hypothetical protein
MVHFGVHGHLRTTPGTGCLKIYWSLFPVCLLPSLPASGMSYQLIAIFMTPMRSSSLYLRRSGCRWIQKPSYETQPLRPRGPFFGLFIAYPIREFLIRALESAGCGSTIFRQRFYPGAVSRNHRVGLRSSSSELGDDAYLGNMEIIRVTKGYDGCAG